MEHVRAVRWFYENWFESNLPASLYTLEATILEKISEIVDSAKSSSSMSKTKKDNERTLWLKGFYDYIWPPIVVTFQASISVQLPVSFLAFTMLG